tara:strand:+ start:413 stop:862 length:450 start_codon:yes stop_codon:yes gene_type:complete
MNDAEKLLHIYAEFNWDDYIEISTKLVAINRHSIDAELEKLPGQYAKWSGLLSVAEKEVKRARTELEQYVAVTRQEETEHRASSGLKATDKYLESYVLSQPAYKEHQDRLTAVKFKYNLLKDLVSALSVKKDTLIQLSANSRAETKIYN